MTAKRAAATAWASRLGGAALGVAVAAGTPSASADPLRLIDPPVERVGTSAGPIAIRRIVEGLDEPWSVGFLPDGAILITEREGRLWRIPADAAPHPVSGLPAVADVGQGGLLDLLVPRDFAQTRELLFTFARAQDGGQGTALARAVLSADSRSLTDVRVLFEAAPGFSGGRHFGSRLAEGPDGHIFLTIGDRGSDDSAQDRGNHNGSVIRLNRDGSVPQDNPFVGQAGRPEIWSYGHRNPQGLAFGPDGTLWAHEHGARGGDEVNRIRPGRNYGWPVIAYGRHYSGLPIGEGTRAPGLEQPVLYWDPSIAPSGLAVHSGRLWPEWEGDLFVGSLQFHMIARIDPENGFAQERISAEATDRVRDVREGPDGALWFLSVNEGALFRMQPDTPR